MVFQFGDDTKRKQEYRELVEKLRCEEVELGIMYVQQEACLRELKDNTKLLEALEMTVTVYTEQVERHRQFHGDVAAGDLNKYDILKQFLRRLNITLELIDSHRDNSR